MILPDDARRKQDLERRAARAALGLPPLRRAVTGDDATVSPRPSSPSAILRPGGSPFCECGCGERPIRPTARFRPGHDSIKRARERFEGLRSS